MSRLKSDNRQNGQGRRPERDLNGEELLCGRKSFGSIYIYIKYVKENRSKRRSGVVRNAGNGSGQD